MVCFLDRPYGEGSKAPFPRQVNDGLLPFGVSGTPAMSMRKTRGDGMLCRSYVEAVGRAGLEQRGLLTSGVMMFMGHQGSCTVGASSSQEGHIQTVGVIPPPIHKENTRIGNVAVDNPFIPTVAGDVAVRGNETDFSGGLRIFRSQLEFLIGEVDQALAKVDASKCSKGLTKFYKMDHAEKEKPSQLVGAHPIVVDVEQAFVKVDKGPSSKQALLAFKSLA